MTENASTAPRPEPIQHIETWAACLAQALAQISGSPLPCTVVAESPVGLAQPVEGDLWIVCASSGGLRGEMGLRFPAASILRLAQIFMSEPVAPEAELTSDHREATLELLRQVAGLVASALKPRWGEVQLGLDVSAGTPSWPASSTAWLRVGENPPAVLVELHLSAALVAALRAEKTAADASVATPDLSIPPTPCSPQESKVKLDLLMDVELAVTVRFGSRRLLLREVLDLNPGAVVDLDRKVQEPVDVLLDGRLVARGEVVVMDGNYGLRVTEVAPAGL